jgi:hypothetical protein
MGLFTSKQPRPQCLMTPYDMGKSLPDCFFDAVQLALQQEHFVISNISTLMNSEFPQKIMAQRTQTKEFESQMGQLMDKMITVLEHVKFLAPVTEKWFPVIKKAKTLKQKILHEIDRRGYLSFRKEIGMELVAFDVLVMDIVIDEMIAIAPDHTEFYEIKNALFGVKMCFSVIRDADVESMFCRRTDALEAINEVIAVLKQIEQTTLFKAKKYAEIIRATEQFKREIEALVQETKRYKGSKIRTNREMITSVSEINTTEHEIITEYVHTLSALLLRHSEVPM